MKNIHLESDHEILARLTKSFTLALNPEDAVGFDCSECGELFKNIETIGLEWKPSTVIWRMMNLQE